MTKKHIQWLIPAAAVIALLVLWQRPRQEPPADTHPLEDDAPPPAEADATTAFDLDAHLARVRDWDPETGFDHAAHERALKALGPVHHEALLASAEAAHALREFEEQAARRTAEGAAAADALDELRQRREALLRQRRDAYAADETWAGLQEAVEQAETAVRETRIELQPALDGPRRVVAEERDSPEAEQAREAVQAGVMRMREANELLRARRNALREREEALAIEQPEALAATEALAEIDRAIADQEQILAAQLAQDDSWRALKEQSQAAEDAVTAARTRLQMAIRARMQIEHEIARSRRNDTASETQ